MDAAQQGPLDRVLYQITDEYALVRRAESTRIYLAWREDGKPRWRSTRSSELDVAKQRARELILEVGQVRDVDPNDAPIKAVMDRHYLRVGKKKASKSTIKRSLALWGEYFPRQTVAQLDAKTQREFKAWLEKKGYSQGYVRRVIGDGKAALNWAWEEGELSRVPFVRLPPIASGYPHYARIEQLVKFLNAPMPAHLFTYCMIRLNTGCRGDAARDLQPFQVDSYMGLVTLNPPARTQTKKFRPIVPLTDFLRAYLASQKAETWYVHWHGRHVDSIKKAWRAVRDENGLPPWFVARVLRHTVGSELRRRGVPGWDVSGQLGHKKGESAPTTENYAKFDPDYLAAARTALDAWMVELATQVPRMAEALKPTGNVVVTGRFQKRAKQGTSCQPQSG